MYPTRTVAVDLAAEARKAKEMKAKQQEMKEKGLNLDGTPYIHLPGEPPHPVPIACSVPSPLHTAQSMRRV